MLIKKRIIQPIKCTIIENEAETPAGGGAEW